MGAAWPGFIIAGLGIACVLLWQRLSQVTAERDALRRLPAISPAQGDAERAEQSADIARARDTIEIASRARADFLAVMSHEMRTPLNGIVGMTGLMLDTPEPQQDLAAHRHALRVIQDSADQLLRIINDILDFSRLDAGKMELDETAFDIRSVIGSAVELLAAEASAKGLSLTLEVADDVPRRAAGDPGRLRQVLLNLIGNAVKFTREGGVRVDVARLAAPLDADGKPQPGALRLGVRVTDTGIGMAPDAMEGLFAPFAQADSSISRRFGGTGLGLAISRQLVEHMGGRISVASTPGQGTCFSFDILLRARRASDEGRGGSVARRGTGHDQGSTPSPARKLMILLADDNATNRLVISRMLERMGHEVIGVADGLEAVAAAGAGGFDLVVMDLMMPELDGIAAARRIRALDGEAGRVRIVGLSADSTKSQSNEWRDAGMDGFATKPITGARLAELLAEMAPAETEAMPVSAVPVARPLLEENRAFDPAILDAFAREAGPAAAAARVDALMGNHPRRLAALRLMAADDPALRDATAELADDAARLGLMQAARAALTVGQARTEANLDVLAAALRHGADELRGWRGMFPG